MTYPIEILRIDETLGDTSPNLLLKFGIIVQAILFARFEAVEHIPIISSRTVGNLYDISETFKDLAGDTAP